MRLIVLVGLAAGLSVSAQFVTAETHPETKVPVRVISSAGKSLFKWFFADDGSRVVRHSDEAGSRIKRAGVVEMLAQIVALDHDVYRFGVTIGGRDLPGATSSLKAVEEQGAPALTPWVAVLRQVGGVEEGQVLAVDRRAVVEGSGSDTVERVIRVQRQYWFKSAGELLDVRLKSGTALTVVTNRGSGTFNSNGPMIGDIVGFWMTGARLSVVTTAQIAYEFDVIAADERLSFQFSGRAGFVDAAGLLRTQSAKTGADVKMVTKKICETEFTT